MLIFRYRGSLQGLCPNNIFIGLNAGAVVIFYRYRSKSEGVRTLPADHREKEYYAEILTEPGLVEKAVFVRNGPKATILAVPVGKLRRGGEVEIEFGREYAQEAFQLLKRYKGFPNLRIVSFTDARGNPEEDYFQLRWGDPVAFEGCDYTEAACALVLGLYYGYKPEVVAEYVDAMRRLLDQIGGAPEKYSERETLPTSFR